METPILCLDHGFVRLVDSMGSDLSVVRAARVSYDAAWRAGENEKSDEKLINYLWKNKHTTPFEAVTFTFEVKAPIFVFRQWHRHRTQSYNEMSARYTELPEEFYVPKAEVIGEQSKFNKQARELNRPLDDDYLMLKHSELDSYNGYCQRAFGFYREMILAGWPRELARMVLPLSTYSHMFCTMNLLNAFKFITLRSDSHAQYEIRVYSDAMLSFINSVVPVCAEAFVNAKG
jgi:thymidylate synthase (FAD)